jgi:cysteinyl-tRNA synthetase
VHGWGPAGKEDSDWLRRFQKEVARDLNTSKALAVVWGLVKEPLPDTVKKATILAMDQVLGLDLANWTPQLKEIPEAVLQMAEKRNIARENKDWARADALRDQIIELGYEIEDGPEGTLIKRA